MVGAQSMYASVLSASRFFYCMSSVRLSLVLPVYNLVLACLGFSFYHPSSNISEKKFISQKNYREVQTSPVHECQLLRYLGNII